MPRMTKPYTPRGNQGETSLGGGERVAKDSLRVAANGAVDELSACIGVSLAVGLSPRLAELLRAIQNELFHIGSDLSFTEAYHAAHPERALPHIREEYVERLEAQIDEFNAELGPLQNFIMPGGAPGGAQLHVARTVCRRAERALVSLARAESISPLSLKYLNRLSDLLFAMARYENRERGVAETLWNMEL